MSDKLLDDRKLLIEPGKPDEPLWAAIRLGCFASVMLAILIDMALFALMLAGELPWVFWPYPAVPALLWAVLLGVPGFYKSWRGAMTILDAVVKTGEAYLARAGYVVDLNRDGLVGHVKVQPPAIQEVRPIMLNAPKNAAIMPLEVPAIKPMAGDDGDDDDLPQRRVWHCPGGVKVDQETLEDFVDGVFDKGLSRGKWVGEDLERETYDGLVALLEQAKLVEGRKPGHCGKLTVRNAKQARAVLGLAKPG